MDDVQSAACGGRTGIIELDYRIEGFSVLLNEDCILSRYYPLIACKDTLIAALKAKGCGTKRECARLSDEELRGMGIADGHIIALFRRFLSCYDINEAKLKDIRAFTADSEMKAQLAQLARLPGVRLVRALLYYYSGYTSLQKIAQASAAELIQAANDTIQSRGLQCTPPLPKEARTHIAVAKVLTDYSVN